MLLPSWVFFPHFLLGFPRDAPRKESDCHRGQQGDWKRDGLSSGEDGSPCDGDSEVRRSSKEGEGSVSTNTHMLTCPDVFLYILTDTCQHKEAGTSIHRCIHTHKHTHTHAHIHTGLNTHNNMKICISVFIPMHIYMERHKVLGLYVLIFMPLHTQLYTKSQICRYVLRYQNSSTYT